MTNFCKGSTYRYAIDNKHLFIYISNETGNVCYYCHTKGNN
jgi:hypothetical protein